LGNCKSFVKLMMTLARPSSLFYTV
jgi:hypothetical protein